jgi:uncharacterized membrane protein
MLQSFLISVHVAANLLWIGSALAMAYLATQKGAVVWALKLHQKLANPAFYVSFAAGVTVVLLHPETYMKAHWFHGKLTLALAVIGIHHVLAAKVKRAQKSQDEGQTVSSGGTLPGTLTGSLGWALAGSAILVVVLAVFKQVLIP